MGLIHPYEYMEDSLEKRQLGQSDLMVSPLCLGCWALAGGSGWGDQDEQVAIDTIHAALDHGINFLDTAEGYGGGYSEEIVGKALVGRREQAVLATKISPTHTQPAELRGYLEASLRRLQTDYIDHYIVHWPITTHSVSESFAVLQELKQEGKVRSIGVSNYGARQLGELLETGAQIDCNQLHYSLLSRAIEFEILPLLRENGIGASAYMPLTQGLLVGKYRTVDEVPPFRARTRHFSSERPMARHDAPGAETETFAAIEAVRQIAESIGEPMANVALAWVMARPGLVAAIGGARSPAQVERNVKAMETVLSAETIAHLDAATEELKNTLGANPDYWNTEDKSRSY